MAEQQVRREGKPSPYRNQRVQSVTTAAGHTFVSPRGLKEAEHFGATNPRRAAGPSCEAAHEGLELT